jgi:PAS domain S-box-containing protein
MSEPERESTVPKRWDLAVFRQIFDCLAASVSIAAAEDSTYVEVNEEFLKVSGFSRDEVIGKTPVELRLFADPSDLSAWLTSFGKKVNCAIVRPCSG